MNQALNQYPRSPVTRFPVRNFYTHPQAAQLVGQWSHSLSEIDVHLSYTEVFIRLTHSLLTTSLSDGNLLIATAQRRQSSMSQIPTVVLNQMDTIEWLHGTSDHVAHLQVIWRYYQLFEQRRILRSLQVVLSERGWFSRQLFQDALADLRRVQSGIYSQLARSGLDPYSLDQMLDKEVDLVEWLLELRLWHYVTNQLDQTGIVKRGLHAWWLAEKEVAETVTVEPKQPIGNPGVILTDLRILMHALFDTRLRYMVLMAVVGAIPEIPVDSLAPFLLTLLSNGEMHPNDVERLHSAFDFVSKRASTDNKLDIASRLLDRLLFGGQRAP